MSDVSWVILILIIAAVLWISGASLMKPVDQPGAETPATDSGTVSNGSTKKEPAPVIRIYTSNIWTERPDEEYIELLADYSNTKEVNISGWKLQNRDNKIFIIPTGAGLPYVGQVNTQSNIKLGPGEKAIIITGKSPIGTGFRPNICTGYFNRLYEFKPRLPENCPPPDKEPGVDAQNNACFSYIKTLPRCQTPTLSNAPSNVNFACREFIDQKLSYASCVETHKKDAGFFANEWRVYLERNEEAWSNVRETIKLFDQNSNLVAETSI
ncbi:MAG: hypothetical protein AAB527_00760 [Patescibacteria group bacterium]